MDSSTISRPLAKTSVDITIGGVMRRMLPAVAQATPLAEGWLVDEVAGLVERLLRVAVLHELDGQQRALAPHVAHDRVTVGHLRHPGQRELAESGGVVDEVAPPASPRPPRPPPHTPSGCRRRRCWGTRRASDSASSSRTAMAVTGKPFPMPLPMRHHVGDDALVVHGEPRAGAAEAGGDLVDDEQRPGSACASFCRAVR